MLLIVTTTLLLCLGSFSALAQQIPSFGRAASYGVVAAAGISSTGPTVIHGDAGSYPTPDITGFPPGTVVDGTLHVAADVPTQGAIADAGTAYAAFAGMVCNTSDASMDVGGTTIGPGVHCYGGTLDITGILTLDAHGNDSAVFIFVSSTIFTANVASELVLIGAANPCNVYFIAGTSAVIQTTQILRANILAAVTISFVTGASVTGRVYAGCVSGSGAVTCQSNDLAAGVMACPNCVPSSNSTGNSSSSTGQPSSSTAGQSSSSTGSISSSSSSSPQSSSSTGQSSSSSTGQISSSASSSTGQIVSSSSTASGSTTTSSTRSSSSGSSTRSSSSGSSSSSSSTANGATSIVRPQVTIWILAVTVFIVAMWCN